MAEKMTSPSKLPRLDNAVVEDVRRDCQLLCRWHMVILLHVKLKLDVNLKVQGKLYQEEKMKPNFKLSYRRSVAAKRRLAERVTVDVTFQQPDATSARRGTGKRQRPKKWPTSFLTGRSHKLVIPPEVPGNKFVLVVGDSHLRAIADGIVPIPGKDMSFGIMSTPGGAARDLRKELVHAALPRCPDAVCLLAPSNNLTASKTVTEAGADFADLIASACSRWPKVFVLDFPPRLTTEPALQEVLRNEFCSVARRMGVKYFSAAEHFPLTHLNMWSRDGVHLSDDVGMPILAQLMWWSSYTTLDETSSKPVTPPKPWVPKFSPKVVVRGEKPAARPPADPFAWTIVGRGEKRCERGSPVESFIPSSPVLFSADMLDAMDVLVPADCTSAESVDSVSFATKVDGASDAVEAPAELSPASPADIAVDEDASNMQSAPVSTAAEQ
ncbi:uncharacterized protein [Pempheris klunzingeri]|uniref:uncharacterized protein n=1 Tax=Pempheris klunzingeri TaxID=3127111 RepID=UPI0039801F6B